MNYGTSCNDFIDEDKELDSLSQATTVKKPNTKYLQINRGNLKATC